MTTAILQRPTMWFSGIGHLYMHFACTMFFTLVLALEIDWKMPFYELNKLWTIGAALVGIAAIPAGRLGDKWSARGMMAIFFLGIGISIVACGFSNTPSTLVITLAGVGMFAAIYHPIAIPWLIANTKKNTGKVLAINGIFGGLGPAIAGLVIGILVEYVGWRWAFWIPGGLIIATGILMLWCIKAGLIPTSGLGQKNVSNRSRRDAVRVFAILLFSMFISGLVYATTQAVLPKFLTERIGYLIDGSVARAGLMVGIVYFISAITQMFGGYLADKYPLKQVYVMSWFMQIFFLSLVASIAGFGAYIAILFVTSLSSGMLPAENMLLYRYSPEKHKGLAFGLKYILSFGAAPVGLHLVSFVQENTGEFYWLFMGLSIVTVLVFLTTLLLPPVKNTAV